MDAGKWGKARAASTPTTTATCCCGRNGPTREDRPLWDRRDELVAKYGEEMANFMINISRNLCLYPNVYIMDQFSSQIRHFRPISADQTEVTIYCIAPKGESQENRSKRIRQYEDFFNATGMATPDDLEEFRSCKKTYRATAAPWNDMSRGATHEIARPRRARQGAGHDPVIASGVRTEDEGLYPIQHGYWKEVMDGPSPKRSSPPDAVQSQPTQPRGTRQSAEPMTNLTTAAALKSAEEIATLETSAPSSTRRPASSMTASSMSGSSATTRTPSSGCPPGTSMAS